MNKTWKPMTGGILIIIYGSFYVLAGLVVAVRGGNITLLAGIPFATRIPTLLGSPMILFGAMAIVGGTYAIKRKV